MSKIYCNLCHLSTQSWGDFSLWYRLEWCWMGKWHTNVQLTLKQMRIAVLELALCQTKLQLRIQHPAWLLGRKPAPDLAALLHFSTIGGLFKAVERTHESWLFHFLFQHQRCKEASMQSRNGAMSQLGVSEHLTDTLTQIKHSSHRDRGWLLLLGASSQVPLQCPLCYALKLSSVIWVLSEAGVEGPVLWSTLCHLHRCCAPHILRKLFLV